MICTATNHNLVDKLERNGQLPPLDTEEDKRRETWEETIVNDTYRQKKVPLGTEG